MKLFDLGTPITLGLIALFGLGETVPEKSSYSDPGACWIDHGSYKARTPDAIDGTNTACTWAAPVTKDGGNQSCPGGAIPRRNGECAPAS